MRRETHATQAHAPTRHDRPVMTLTSCCIQTRWLQGFAFKDRTTENPSTRIGTLAAHLGAGQNPKQHARQKAHQNAGQDVHVMLSSPGANQQSATQIEHYKPTLTTPLIIKPKISQLLPLF